MIASHVTSWHITLPPTNMENPLPSKTAPIPIEVTIRFATALPDLTIFIPDAASTTVSSLKRQIRTLRHDDTSKRKLKLIYGGKVLPTGDGRTLAEHMRFTRPSAPPPPPPPSGKGKGKAVEIDIEDGVTSSGDTSNTPEARKVYVHCAIGDEVTEEELRIEDDEGVVGFYCPVTLVLGTRSYLFHLAFIYRCFHK